jgi:hypothetical protein
MNKYSDPDPGSGIKHPGSATLIGIIPVPVLHNNKNLLSKLASLTTISVILLSCVSGTGSAEITDM